MAKNRPNTDPRGHSLRIYSEIYDSAAFACLSPYDVLAYLALLRELKQYNNGDLSLPLSRARTCGISHPKTLARSLRALCAVGLVAIARRGGCTRGGQRLPNLYRVTDRDCYEIPKLHLEALSATNEWKRVTTVEQGQQLILAADDAVKKEASKLKSLGHPVTATRARSEVVRPITRARSEPWNAGLGHVVNMAKNPTEPLSMRVTGGLSPTPEKSIHRAPAIPPLYIATPTGDLGLLDAVSSVSRLPAPRTLIGRVLRRVRPVNLPNGYHAARSGFSALTCLEGASHG